MTESTASESPTAITDLGEAFPRTAAQMKDLRAKGVAASKRMLAFIDRSPTPYHAAENLISLLKEDGFVELRESDTWTLQAGDRRYVMREGSTLIAFVVGAKSPATGGFRIVGAHTDSPTFRVKPRGARSTVGYRQLGVEPYGGALLSTWMDRDLSVAGRVLYQGADGSVQHQLVDLREPVARIPNLAIHLDRKVNADGLVLNQQRHMVPIVGLGDELDLRAVLARAIRQKAEAILSYELSLYDTQPGSIGGMDDEFVFSARLDNLASCHMAMEALCGTPDGIDHTAVVVLYDHEECGSRSSIGAAGPALIDALNRIAMAHPDPQPQAIGRAKAASILISSDMAHAVHPNYAEQHDSEHAPRLNRGLVIKTNANQSYATSGQSAAEMTRLCRMVEYEPQQFVMRSDLRCGSSIGPIAAAGLGISTVDVGAPMLSMHSCREMAGTLDVYLGIRTFAQLFR